MNDVTLILKRIEAGDTAASEELLPLVYDELRTLARHRVANEHATDAMQATVLVHEAYLRLVGSDSNRWKNRGHFFGAAAEAMRRILVEQARRRRRLKRGGDVETMSLEAAVAIDDQRDEQLVQLDDALNELSEKYPEKAELVKLKFFAGMTTHDAATILGMAPRTAERNWAFARAWLYREMAPKNE